MKLGIALCEGLESGSFEAAESVIRDIANLLGADHPRVQKGHEKLAHVKSLKAEVS